MLKHSTVTGINFNGKNFIKKLPDSTKINNYQQQTIGLFAQDDWKITSKFTAQAGIRIDFNNQYGNFILPRLSLLYKLNNHFTTRLGGGLGYKIPTVFASEIDERDYPSIIVNNALNAETSSGINWDINFKQTIAGWHLTVNQLFYITEINKPVTIVANPGWQLNFINQGKPLNTQGFETYIAATHDELEIYLGYTYTLARQLYSQTNPNVSLSARNKFASVIAYEFSEKFRAGIEAAYTGTQYLDNGSTTNPYLFAAAMLRYNLGKFAMVLNCENLFDYRQTRQENIVLPPTSNPGFKQIWAPLDGRVINLSVNFKW
jgi:outer membrane receptor for ferrienterochelin and colicin